ncbi:MAG: sulfurtransferase TusA family protein [Desulfurococcaceae archaeon]
MKTQLYQSLNHNGVYRLSCREVFDFRRKSCPEPVIKTIRKVTSMSSGDCLIIYVDKEDCLELIKNTLELMGIKHRILREQNYWIINIEK